MSKRQLKRFWVLLVTLIMIFCSVRIFAASDVMANDYQKIVSLPIGIGDGKIAYTPNIEDIEKRGPESFAVEANGNILILDTIDN